MNFRRVWWRSVASMNAYTALLLTTETEILNTPYRLQNNISMSYLHRWWYWRHASYWKEGSKKTTIAAATYGRRCGCVKDAAWGNGEHGWSIKKWLCGDRIALSYFSLFALTSATTPQFFSHLTFPQEIDASHFYCKISSPNEHQPSNQRTINLLAHSTTVRLQ